MILLTEVEKLDGVKIYGEKNNRIKKFSGVSIDSRTIKKTELFIAIKGESTDGHKYLANVFKSGVKAAMVNEKYFNRLKKEFKSKVLISVPDTTLALGGLARNRRRDFNVPVLCVGGSNGKTTTKDLISCVLSRKYKVLKSEGNFNNHIGLPLSLLKLDKTHTMCVLEAGCSHFGEIKYLCGIAEPDAGLVTNIGKEHLEFFKNEKGVARAEFELYDHLSKNNKTCFFNLDDKFIKTYSAKIKGNKFTYSYSGKPDVKGKFLNYTSNFEPVINIKYGSKDFNVTVSTFGKHSIYNGIAAAAAGLFYGVKPAEIKKAFAGFKPASSKRMELEKVNGITYINDSYNSNPDSVKLGLETLNEYKTKGNIHIALSDMLELGKASKKEHSDIGKLASQMGFKNLYTYGSQSYHTFKSARKVANNFFFESKDDMARMMRAVIKKGDIVYVKGSRGMKMEEVLNSIKGQL